VSLFNHQRKECHGRTVTYQNFLEVGLNTYVIDFSQFVLLLPLNPSQLLKTKIVTKDCLILALFI